MERKVLIKRTLIVISFVTLLYLSKTKPFLIVQVDGSSMSPTLSNREYRIAYKTSYSKLKIGDIVVAKSPSNSTIIKRIASLEGNPIPSQYNTDISLTPSQSAFLIGDNEEESYDSRDYGCVLLGDSVYVIK